MIGFVCSQDHIEQRKSHRWRISFTKSFFFSNEEISNFLDPLDLPRISHEQKQFLEVNITLEEVTKVVQAQPKGKAPGPYGFAAEF